MTSKYSLLGVVVRKELIDGLRDRRSIISALVPLAIIPVLLFFSLDSVADRVESGREITVPVVGAGQGGPLVEWLDRQAGIEIEAGPADARAEVSEGNVGFVLVIPDDFGERFARSRTAEVQIVVDGSDDRAQQASARIRSLIRAYSQMIGSQRLIVRGVSPEVTRPVQVDTLDLQSDRERAAVALMFLPVVLLMAAFVGGLQIAIDSTAGERERGSLERLLVNPVPRPAIVAGKWLAAVAFSCASICLVVVGLWAVVEHSPLQRIGFRLDLGPEEIAGLIMLALPLAPALVALQMAVATLARSYKEAQSYVSFLMLLPMVPMVLMMDGPPETELWNLFVPMLGQFVLMNEVLEGQALTPGPVAITSLVSLACAIALLLVTARLFRSERIIFGRSA